MPNDTTLGMPNQQEFELLVREANGGTPEALDRLRKYLDAHPEIWQAVGDLARHAQEALVQAIANGNELLAESVRRKAAEMRSDVAGKQPSHIEKLAAERLVASWLELQFVNAQHAADAGKSLPMARYILLAKDSAQRRFDAAVKCLSLVREKLVAKPEPEPAIKLRRKKVVLKFPLKAAQ